MSSTAADLVARAKAEIENLTRDQVVREAAADALLVDLREPAEVEASGMIEGAVHAPRGMLEFYADPTSPYHREQFDPTRRTILYCASGGRSALAAATLQSMGYIDVAHLDGGINAWQADGHPLVRAA